MKLTYLFLVLGLTAGLLLSACGPAAAPTVSDSDADTAAAGNTEGQPAQRLRVVTTVSPIANIVLNVGGDRIELVNVVPEGTNSHTFEPAPSDAKLLAAADVIFVNGLNLEEPTIKLAEASKKAATEIIALGEETVTPDQYIYDFSFPKEAGSPNPHLWMNPLYALSYAQVVRDALSNLDPANADYYDANYQVFDTRIQALDQAIQETLATIPADNRKLLTYHDSFAYFAPRYGMTVIGAIQPADFSEPSAREVAELIKQLKESQAPAIFGSEVFSSPVLAQIAEEAGATYVDTLRDDALPGEPGDDNHTYLGMMVEDVRTMALALGGDAGPIAHFDTSNVFAPSN